MESLSLTAIHNPQPGWYRGDFHAHTLNSDGVLTAPDLLALARAEGLDFFAITDHNGIGAYAQFGEQSGTLVIPGMEVTFKSGHFNVFGIQAPSDWMSYICAGQLVFEPDPAVWSNSSRMAEMLSQGLVTSINHPLLRPWAWEFPDLDLRNVRCLEIWNDPSWADNHRDNPRAVRLWTEWLNAGFRITAIGGSDFHRPIPPPGDDKPAERLGLPSTYVYAESLSGRAILDGLLQRRAYVSMGPRAAFVAASGRVLFGIGDDAGETAAPLELRASVRACHQPATAQLLCNGHVVAETAVEDGRAELAYRHQPTAGQSEWYRFDVWGTDGQMLIVTNPIFAGPARTPDRVYFGDYAA